MVLHEGVQPGEQLFGARRVMEVHGFTSARCNSADQSVYRIRKSLGAPCQARHGAVGSALTAPIPPLNFDRPVVPILTRAPDVLPGPLRPIQAQAPVAAESPRRAPLRDGDGDRGRAAAR